MTLGLVVIAMLSKEELAGLTSSDAIDGTIQNEVSVLLDERKALIDTK